MMALLRRRCSDSSFENPRSRKTFPVDGVILTALFFAMLLLQLLYRPKAVATDPLDRRATEEFTECGVIELNQLP